MPTDRECRVLAPTPARPAHLNFHCHNLIFGEAALLIPIIGSSGREQPSKRTFAPDEEIPESGIYQVVHGTGETDSIVFLRGGMFPACEHCGIQVRYLVLRTAPYIFDDEDFK
jgi:hypothetical protein